jgi:polyhydroxyalkanoate synthesis repressor PhaR
MNDNTRLIQKYNNRRLYDTLEHRYITLDDIRQLVLNGVDFAVLDQRTQVDITVSTLLNVLSLAQSSQAEPLIERQFLLDAIRTFCASSRAEIRSSPSSAADFSAAEMKQVA